jgi:hypothetical protein
MTSLACENAPTTTSEANMSDLETSPAAGEHADADAHATPGHGAADPHHDAGHGGHGGPALGPIDWRRYGAGILGAAMGLVVGAVMAVTTGYVTL